MPPKTTTNRAHTTIRKRAHAQAVAAVGGALAVGAFRYLWVRPRFGAGALFGAGLGILALSRPFEGALLGAGLTGALAVGAILASVRSITLRSLVPAALGAALLLGTALGALGWYNRAVTGSFLTMPYQLDARQYAAAPNFLFRDLPPAPSYRHEVIEEFWMDWARERFLASREARTLLTSVPEKLLRLGAFFLGPGMVALVGLLWAPASRWRTGVSGLAALLTAGSLLTVATYPHYLAPATVLFLLLLGWGLQGLRRRGRAPGHFNLSVPVILGMFGFSIALIFFFLRDEPSKFAVARAEVAHRLAGLQGRHLVLVTYGPRHSLLTEWVYNSADIDGAQVVWARSMGDSRDRELIHHFEDRSVWHIEVEGHHYRLEPRDGP